MNYYLGIDVSKGYADFTMLNEKFETVVENFQLDDNFEGPVAENAKKRAKLMRELMLYKIRASEKSNFIQ